MRSTPIFSDLDLDDVAGLQGHRRVAVDADAGGCAGEDHVARFQREDGRGMGHELRDAEDELARARVLQRLAVEPLHDPQPAPVPERPDRDDGRQKRAEGVEALAPEPLAVSALQVAGADVVRARVAADDRERRVHADPPRALADDDDELRFGVHVRGLGREDDRVVGPPQRVGELPEEERLARRLGALLDRVVAVVEADADDLAGLGPPEALLPQLVEGIEAHREEAILPKNLASPGRFSGVRSVY